MRVCYPKRSSISVSNFLSILLNGALLIWKSCSNLLSLPSQKRLYACQIPRVSILCKWLLKCYIFLNWKHHICTCLTFPFIYHMSHCQVRLGLIHTSTSSNSSSGTFPSSAALYLGNHRDTLFCIISVASWKQNANVHHWSYLNELSS